MTVPKVKKVKAAASAKPASEGKALTPEQEQAKLDAIYARQGLTNPGIKRMSRRAGVAHLAVAAYGPIRDVCRKQNIKVLTKANAVLAYSKRRTMRGKQIKYGIVAAVGDTYMVV